MVKSIEKNLRRMTALELNFVIRELQFLRGAVVENVYQQDDWMVIKASKDNNDYYVFTSPARFHLIPEREFGIPKGVSLILRKYLNNKPILSIEQYNFNKLIEIKIGNNILLIELFDDGNIILTDDKYKIIMPLKFFKERDIMTNKIYKWPPAVQLDFLSFRRFLKGSSKNILQTLFDLGFGNVAEDICNNAGVNGENFASKLSEKDFDLLFESMNAILRNKINAKIVLENGEMIDVIPFEVKKYEGKDKQSYDSLNKALAYFYEEKTKELTYEKTQITEESVAEDDEIKERKIEEEHLQKDESEIGEENIILKNRELVESILTKLRIFKESYSWHKIKELIEREDTPEANAIKNINEDDETVVVNLEGKDVKLFLNKTVEENAAEYELIGSKEEIQKECVENKEKGEKKSKRGRWYQKYRYFWSLDGLLVVGGVPGKLNERLIEKYTEPMDLVLKADVPNAPFMVIKQRKDRRYKPEELTAQGIIEAAEFAAAFSDAWKKGGSVEVFSVRPDQLIKTDGGFDISGEKNYFKKIRIRLGVGVDLKRGKFVIGPVKTIGAKYDYYLTIVPGSFSVEELAKQIKEKLASKALYPDEKDIIEKIPLEELIEILPGSGMIFE